LFLLVAAGAVSQRMQILLALEESLVAVVDLAT